MRSRNFLCVIALALVHVGYAEDKKPQPPAPLYDPDPQHLWNRLHAALWDRVGPDGIVYGHDRLDPLLWAETEHLLVGPSRDAALNVLQEFLETHGEKLIDDPVKRAVLQRDLWAIFDWLAGPNDSRTGLMNGNAALLRRPLAKAIGRLALDADEIKKLPDTYAAAVASQKFPMHYDPESRATSFLPPDLFAAEKWVCLGRNGSDLLVPAHARSFSRSSFQVFLNFPAGRQATKNYVYELSGFKEPFIFAARQDGRFIKLPNPKLPQFPDGTQVALVRSALLIDSEGHLRATPLVESVQLRVYPDRAPDGNFEFVLSRARLFAGMAGGLNALGIDDSDQVTALNPHRFDQIEHAGHRGLGVRRRCAGCHREPGIHSFNTFVGMFPPLDLQPSFHDTEKRERGETAAIRHKQTRYDWGLLEGILSAGRGSAASSP